MSADAYDLSGAVALVTGAAGGIGRATAGLLAERGASIVMTDASEGVLAIAEGIGATGFVHDVPDPASTGAVVGQALAACGRLDVLVNPAGWDRAALFADTDPEVWQRAIAINYVGVLARCHAALPALRARGGAVVSIAPDLARVGGWGEAVYAAAEAGVRVNCVPPRSPRPRSRSAFRRTRWGSASWRERSAPRRCGGPRSPRRSPRPSRSCRPRPRRS